MNEITNTEQLTQALTERYCDILKDLDPLYIYNHFPDRPNELAGLFLASVPKNYHHAKNKIMIIGRETKSWAWFDTTSYTKLPLKDFIQKSMNWHQGFLIEKLDGKNTKGRGFHNFTREVAKKSGRDGIVYTNLFCLSWNKKSPTHSPHFEIIKKYSEQLLKAQIAVLNPQIIIFAHGNSANKYRETFFPYEVFENSRNFISKGVSNKQLWESYLREKTHCFHIQHPSSRSRDSAKARNSLSKNFFQANNFFKFR